LLRKAEGIGWQHSDEIQSLMSEMLAIETDERSKSADALLAARHRAEKYGHGSLYQAWLIESWSSHASPASAHPYYEAEGEFALALWPEPTQAPINVPSQCVVAGLVALEALPTLLPEFEKQAIADHLHSWEARLTEIAGARRH